MKTTSVLINMNFLTFVVINLSTYTNMTTYHFGSYNNQKQLS